jgi:hypothetical protein
MERILHLHWDQLVLALLTMPDPNPRHLESLQAGQTLLDRIRSEDFSGDYLWNLTNEVFRAAFVLISDTATDAATEHTQCLVDDEKWSSWLQDVDRCASVCDPSIGEAFL